MQLHTTALCAALALGGLAAAHADTLAKVRDSGRITLAYRESSVPFSYLDNGKPIGMTVEISQAVADAVKKAVNRPDLKVQWQAVTSQNRMPLLANGTIDLECGSTTNNVERQQQVSFTITHFLTASRWVTKKSSNIKSLTDLKGKTVVSTAGTTNIKQLNEANAAQNLGINIVAAKDHAEAFLMVETDRAVAFVMDDILLAGLVAASKAPATYEISADGLSKPEPYGIMLRREDPAFKKVVDAAMSKVYTSGEITGIYDKWFVQAIPPKGLNLNTPMSAELKKLMTKPTDSPNPADY